MVKSEVFKKERISWQRQKGIRYRNIIRSTSSSVTSSLVRSYNFVVLGLSCAAISCAFSKVPLDEVGRVCVGRHHLLGGVQKRKVLDMKTHVVLFVSLLIIFLIGCQVEEVQEIAPEEPIVEKVKVVPTISLVSVPTSVKENEPLAVSWNLESKGPLTAVHTAIHYDSTSHPGIFTTEVGPQDSGYNILTKEYASGEFLVPSEFSTQISIPKGISNMYLRAHAIIDGKNYWTDETTVNVEKVVIKPIVPPAPKINYS